MAYKQDSLQSGVYEEKHHKIYSGKQKPFSEPVEWLHPSENNPGIKFGV